MPLTSGRRRPRGPLRHGDARVSGEPASHRASPSNVAPDTDNASAALPSPGSRRTPGHSSTAPSDSPSWASTPRRPPPPRLPGASLGASATPPSSSAPPPSPAGGAERRYRPLRCTIATSLGDRPRLPTSPPADSPIARSPPAASFGPHHRKPPGEHLPRFGRHHEEGAGGCADRLTRLAESGSPAARAMTRTMVSAKRHLGGSARDPGLHYPRRRE